MIRDFDQRSDIRKEARHWVDYIRALEVHPRQQVGRPEAYFAYWVEESEVDKAWWDKMIDIFGAKKKKPCPMGGNND